jgi:DnaJ-class molecular chaperone
MLQYYLALEISPHASDEEIRKQYLALIRQHPPERDPIRFQEISTAYEKLKDEMTRIRTRVLDPYEANDPEKAMAELIRASGPAKVRVGLKTLMALLAARKG